MRYNRFRIEPSGRSNRFGFVIGLLVIVVVAIAIFLVSLTKKQGTLRN